MTVDELNEMIDAAAGHYAGAKTQPVKVTVTVKYETRSGRTRYAETYDADITDVKFRNGGILLEADLDIGVT